MAEAYLKSKIREAIAAAEGDKKQAQKLLITWAVRDQSLLLGLTKPHLMAIAGSWIDNILHEQNKKGAATGEVKFSREDINKMVSDSPKSGKRSHILPPPKSSARQASAMRQIADAFKKKEK